MKWTALHQSFVGRALRELREMPLSCCSEGEHFNYYKGIFQIRIHCFGYKGGKDKNCHYSCAAMHWHAVEWRCRWVVDNKCNVWSIPGVTLGTKRNQNDISAERDILVVRTFLWPVHTWYYINKNVFKTMILKKKKEMVVALQFYISAPTQCTPGHWIDFNFILIILQTAV